MLQLPKLRVAELVLIIDSIPLSECTLATEPMLLHEMSKTLRNAVPETVSELEAIRKDNSEMITNFQKVYNDVAGKITDEEQKKVVLNEINQKMGFEYTEKIEPRNKALEEKAMEEVQIDLDGEKMKKLKEVFEKYGLKSYVKRDVYISVGQALGVGV